MAEAAGVERISLLVERHGQESMCYGFCEGLYRCRAVDCVAERDSEQDKRIFCYQTDLRLDNLHQTTCGSIIHDIDKIMHIAQQAALWVVCRAEPDGNRHQPVAGMMTSSNERDLEVIPGSSFL